MKSVDYRRLVIEIFVFSQITRDLMVEFGNLPVVKERFRYETSNVNERLERMRKRLRRVLPRETFDEFEGMICDIVDSCEKNVRKVRLDLRTEMVNKVRWNQVEAAILIGMIGGFIDVVNQISKCLSGKEDSDCVETLRYLRYIDTHIGFEAMNAGVEPDYEKCKDSMIKMYDSIGAEVSAWLAA
jgi:hypothetical protein